eukprot:g28515.t1
MASLQQLRRRGLIGEFVSIYEDEGWHAIFVASDGGRLCRPLIIVADGKPRFIPEKHVPLMLKRPKDGGMSFVDFLRQGVVEWVDVNEENNLFIALHPNDITAETTHLEIEPFTLLGVVSGLIPYPNHNQNLVDFHHLGAGQNASVAVMSYSGYDIEDAIIMNKAALDRGFGRCFVMRRQSVQMVPHSDGQTDLLAPPQKGDLKEGRRGRNKKQSGLDEDGMVRPAEKLIGNDARYRATPVTYKNPVSSYIDRVLLTTDAEGMKVYKIITRQTRRPEVGDKFASRHGQKGVVGLIVPEIDLPFSETGWRPDLIMNPHGFPSRMTVGKMLECIGSKAAVMEGAFANGSAFGGTPAHEIYRTLISHGFAPTGKDYLTSGITGEPIEAYIFCGPIYYQKLKHMVVDGDSRQQMGSAMSPVIYREAIHWAAALDLMVQGKTAAACDVMSQRLKSLEALAKGMKVDLIKQLELIQVDSHGLASSSELHQAGRTAHEENKIYGKATGKYPDYRDRFKEKGKGKGGKEETKEKDRDKEKGKRGKGEGKKSQ